MRECFEHIAFEAVGDPLNSIIKVRVPAASE